MISLYFDAGTGLMIVQAIAAAAAGVLLFSKHAWYKVKVFFGFAKEEDDDDDYGSIDIDEKKDEHKQ